MNTPLIIIDAGHGGKDPGGGSNQYWKEKDLVLDISKYQFERFKELGIPVAMTRTGDVYLSPADRTTIVKNSGAKYCLSNHINAGGGDGAEFIHSIHADGKLENLMAQKVREAGQNVRRVFCKESEKTKGKDYYFMHRDTGAVHTTIAEYGFADSKLDDVEQLRNNWKKYAEAVVMAYCIYLGHSYKPVKAVNTESDIVGHWAEKPILKAKEKGIMKGYPDGTFKPDQALTRAEMAVILDKLGLLS